MLFLLLACNGTPAPPPPDILLVVLDTQRPDVLSAYGAERRTSPQFDAIAAAGVLFEDVTAPGSWTWPSHASLFTGEPPWVHGAHWPPSGSATAGFPQMREDLPTLAERLGAAGYRTVSLSQNCLLEPELGLTRGFDEALCLAEVDALPVRATAEMQSEDDRPLFLFLNLMITHSPYHYRAVSWTRPRLQELHPDYAAEWVRPYLTGLEEPGIDLQQEVDDRRGIQHVLSGDLTVPPEGWSLMQLMYEGETVTQDKMLNDLMKVWMTRGGDSVVAVTSDHGEAFGEHGFVDHQGSIYAELTQVPMVISAPGRLPTGQRVSTPVQLQDLYPTLLDLAGLEAEGSLLPVISGSPRPGPILAAAWPVPVRAEEIGGRFAETWRLYREGNEVLVYSSGDGRELYDVSTDPKMERDIAAANPDRVTALLERAQVAFGEEYTGTVGDAGSMEGHLRALGYLE